MRKTIISLIIVAGIFQLSALDDDFIMHTISNTFNNGMEIFSIDFDLDGDIDLLTAGADCTLWLNDGTGNFNESVNLGNITGARSIRAADLDGDNDNDVVIADISANNVVILENEGDSFEQFTLDNTLVLPHTIDLKDLDGDGDIDILCSEFDNTNAMSEISWWENLGGLDFATKSVVTEIFQQSPFVLAAHIDSDDDMDIVACGEVNGDVYWWQNDGNENFGEEIVIDESINWIHTLAASDLDSDSDLDILGSACMSGQILWWENDSEGDFTRHNLGPFGGVLWMDCADFDLDGDMDLFAVGQGPDYAVLYENDGSENFTPIHLEGDFGDGFGATVADFDNDGDIDLAAVGRNSQQICWWENRYYAPKFGAEPVLGNFPLTVNFTDQSNFVDPISYWFWDFQNDDNFDSFDQNSTFTYNEPGIYSVALTVMVDGVDQLVLEENLIQVFSGHTALLFSQEESSIYCSENTTPELSEAFTLEAWINPDNYGPLNFLGLGHIFDKSSIQVLLHNNFPQYPQQSLAVNMLHENGSSSSSATGENTIQLDVWQHIAVCYDGVENLEIYINGIPALTFQETAPSGGLSDNLVDPLMIGNLADLSRNFTGLIDEVRVWNICRSQFDIQNDMNRYLYGNEPGLISYWQINEGSGSLAYDASSAHNDGIITEAFWQEGIQLQPVSSEDNTIETPDDIVLSNYPNPFNPITTISFSFTTEITESMENCELNIYNIKGQKIRNLTVTLSEVEGSVNTNFTPSPSSFDSAQDDRLGMARASSRIYSVTWNGVDDNNQSVPTGIYFSRLKLGNRIFSKKMLLLK